MPDLLSSIPSPALQAAQAAQVSAETIADALRISEMQYRRLFEMARDGILILDSDEGRITDANPFMTELLGYSHGEMLGKRLWEIGLLPDGEAGREVFRCLKQSGYIRYEDLPLQNQGGERRQVEFISNLYRQNGHAVVQCNIRDITERKRVAAELAAAAAAVAQHERQAAVLEERTRLAREIHDTLAQGFAGIHTQLEAAEASLAKVPELAPGSSAAASQDPLTVSQVQLAFYQAQREKVQVRIGKARTLARESLAEARRSVAALRSPPLGTLPLSEALLSFLTQKVVGTATASSYRLDGVPYALPASLEHCLLRIGQEAVTNAVEHAQAEGITMKLSFKAGQVRLTVCDDGCGFDTGSPCAGRFGIVGMHERAEKVGGRLAVFSRFGEGTQVELTIPVPQNSLTQDELVSESTDL